MREITIKVYQYSELSDAAKERARQWYLECQDGSFEWDCTKDDAKTIGLILHGTNRDGSMSGAFKEDALSCADKIMKEHGETCETYKTAENFIRERDEIVTQAEKDENGEFVNEYELDKKLDECEAEFLRSICEDYRILYEKELEYQSSEEAISEAMEANGYEFDITGTQV